MYVVAVEEEKRESWRKLTRDVGVNLVANLIAAAIVYLLAVAGGYLNANRWIITAILAVAALVAAILLSVYGEAMLMRRGREKHTGWMLLAVLLYSISVAVFLLVQRWVRGW